ncbi:MAG: PVC-type heme-binding CxxCH protein [Ginsengibacter sp.]
MKRNLIACILLMCFSACNNKTETNKTPSTGGLSPSQALTTFRLPEGFKMELVASEPLVADPVAMDVDENGNMYVVELHGYPLDTSGLGKIKLLTDSDGDGIPDKSTLFADHLRLPTGIMRWKKGVLVVDVPDIIYLEDSDNDGKADIKRTMITGIALTNPQHIANTPIFGLDNWIYLAHMGTVTPRVSMEFSDSGSIVRFVDNATAKTLPRNADGRNVRFKPDTYEMEMLSGYTQYGQTFDNWGHHLSTDNSDHLYHEVIAARYLQRNPNLLVEDASDFIPDHGNNCEVYPITINPENQLLTGRGIVTSSCGVTWYQGGLFPDSFKNVTFIAEPVSNIVHADRINEKGATFTASRVYQKKEFLASTDGWFRPVQFYIGPDGALYVIDYYRQIIEHPEWMSEDVNNSGALYNGAEKGRIYRITPTATPKMDWLNKINLGKASTVELVQTLTSNNIWWRRSAQRLLMDRKDTNAISLLKSLLDTTSSPTAAVHALWALEGFHANDAVTLGKALHNAAAGVRENAIQVAEMHLTDFPPLEKELFSLQTDPSAKVRYQLLCTLGNIHNAGSYAAQQRLLMKDIEDKWVQIAALTSANGNELALLQKSVQAFSSASEGKALFFSNCANLIGVSQKTENIKKVIQLAANNNSSKSDWWQAACLKGLSSSFSLKGIPPGNLDAEKSLLLSKFSPTTPPLVRSASIDLLSELGATENNEWAITMTLAKDAAANTKGVEAYRNDAITFLALDKKGDYSSMLEKIITSDEPVSLQKNALRTYNKLAPKTASEFIVGNWKNLSRDLREVGMNVFVSSTGSSNILLDAVKNGTIQSTEISWPLKEHLANSDDSNVRNRARELIVSEVESREEVYKQYLPVLGMKGDTAKGRIVFTTVCGVCHQYQGQDGTSFGPDLGSIQNREKPSIMTDILNPNRSIAVNYDLWTITKKDGENLSGIMSSQTSATITLNQLGGQHITIPRTEIKTMETAQSSAMPVGLEASVSKEQMANLLAFLKNQE